VVIRSKNQVTDTVERSTKETVRHALQFGFYLGSGIGLAVGSATAVVLGDNLFYQGSGLVLGALLGLGIGALAGQAANRWKPVAERVASPRGAR